MSTAIDYHAAQTTMRKAPARKYAGYLLFILCASLYLSPFMRVLLIQTDEGLLVSGAVRVAHGQVFARDFFEIMGPGTFYWLAMFFKLLGVTFLATRVCLFVSSLGTGLLLYFLSRRICGRYQALPCILLAGTYFGSMWPTISHHVVSNFFALASVACAVAWQDKHENGMLFTAGILAAATTFVHLPKGTLLLLALLLWLWIACRRNSASLSSIGIVIGGYTAATGIVLIYFWSRHALWDLVYANFLWPSAHYEAVNIVPYAQGLILDYWDTWAGPVGSVKWRTGLAAVLIVPMLLAVALPAMVPILGVFRRRSLARPEVVLYWLCGWALWLAEYHREDIWHLVFGSPLLLILCVYYLGEYRGKVAGIVLQILAISAVLLATFNLLLVLFAHSTPTRVGTIALFKSDPVLRALDERVTPGEDLFIYPFAPIYYFLSETTNPTRYSGLGYNYNSAAEFQGVVRALDDHRVRYVLWDTGYEAKALRDEFPSAKPVRPEQRIMEPYLESHYQPVWTDHKGILLMERKSQYQ